MAKSQNGWTAGTPAQIGGVDTGYVPGTKVKLPQGLRKGDVATVLFYVAEQFHKTVEPLHPGWCWGYHYKKIEGSKTLSNHASATAVDLNAPEHPMGKAGTFTPKQRAAIDVILDFCEGVVRWGGRYTGRRDDMHFEIVKVPSEVARIARKIVAARTPKPKPPAKPTPSKPAPPKPAPAKLALNGRLDRATITRWQQVMKTPVDGKISDPSDLVKAVQRRLNNRGARLVVDGKGIAQDGRAYATVKALQKHLGVNQTGRLSAGTSSPTVVALQKRLNAGTF